MMTRRGRKAPRAPEGSMKMKKYVLKFWRSNLQLAAGGYETTREVEAKSIATARKKAREIEDACRYGGMTLISIELAQ